ncbi:tRNA glutamyl-Q(34) synthetase GluQRS [Shinella sp. PSBB067]|uniref:tRNA glutamyl-Q(34) synthetase GluQRS n=1 Tax=Shinella sp. PSBB067 TaxID=2715959 RepID=UPI00193C6F25|nr:tRNA glutamyl-Q(34) synthetase GluQRS [Shinella sp. PSBB067]QRI62734.1 tRNA glutamyl-Q(34) synthetase GluQRS [Shinella sp. PSBB067]
MPEDLMQSPLSKNRVFRFAPSPNGLLHLGHALSAILNHDLAAACGGRFLLRIEDIDPARSRPEFEAAIYRDLAWLGLDWERPVRRQSEHLAFYAEALERLKEMGVLYPGFLSRGEVKARVEAHEAAGGVWPRDPDGAPLYPTEERGLDRPQALAFIAEGRQHAWRLDMEKARTLAPAALDWSEAGEGPEGETGTVAARPERWGDIILSRPDAPASYHLAVVLDDAAQGITDVVRGQDLFHATAVHRLLQCLLGLPAPRYTHHGLVPGPDGRKLSKSNQDTGIAAYCGKGVSPAGIRALLAGYGFVLH